MGIICLTCSKDENPVPKTNANFWLYNINSDPEYTTLKAPYNALIVSGGYKKNGIIIYRLKTENAIDDFVAYDITCPYETNTCAMKWNIKDMFYCTCSCCGSKFNLNGGYMEKGPAKYPLRKFNCDYIDDNIHIY